MAVERGKDQTAPAKRSAAGSLCIVMACTDMQEADAVSRLLSKLNNGCLITYRRAEDLIHNVPTSKVALIILAAADHPSVLQSTLQWLRGRWPRCPITVVANPSSNECEVVARQGGAYYLTRPVGLEQWNALLAHALGEPAANGFSSRIT